MMDSEGCNVDSLVDLMQISISFVPLPPRSALSTLLDPRIQRANASRLAWSLQSPRQHRSTDLHSCCKVTRS